jgi:probable rRNA maturation factor
MKLELVEQRTRPEAMPLNAAQLGDLVTTLGHPDWVLNLVLVDDPVMADLNARWYGGHGVTDVLSFTYLEDAGSEEPELASGVGEAACDLWVAPGEAPAAVTAGEVVLAADYVARRCRQEGWDLTSEWALLLVHGTLHVLGWEHGQPEQRQAMRAREAEVLARHGFKHPLLAEEAQD